MDGEDYKKIFLLFFVLLLLFSSGCSTSTAKPQGTEPATLQSTSDELELTDSSDTDVATTEEEPKKPLPNWVAMGSEEPALPTNPEYTEITLDLKNQPSSYKTFGSTYFSEQGLNVDFGGNGFEFEVECGGDVYITYSSEFRTYFQSFVDGEPAIRFSTPVGSDQNLNADYSMLAKGGCGYFKIKETACPKPMNQIYPYYNGLLNVPVPYVPSRKADIVVLAPGTNDQEQMVEDNYKKGLIPFATYEEALADQLQLIREMHGENVPIILMGGMMIDRWETELRTAAQADNVYFIKVTKNRAGAANHPSAEGHKVFAAELTKFIQDNIL